MTLIWLHYKCRHRVGGHWWWNTVASASGFGTRSSATTKYYHLPPPCLCLRLCIRLCLPAYVCLSVCLCLSVFLSDCISLPFSLSNPSSYISILRSYHIGEYVNARLQKQCRIVFKKCKHAFIFLWHSQFKPISWGTKLLTLLPHKYVTDNIQP